MKIVKAPKLEEYVVLQLENAAGEISYECVSKTKLTEKSIFFEAFFKNSTAISSPQKPALLPQEGEGLEIFQLFVLTTQKEVPRSLLRCLERDERVTLSPENLAAMMKQADVWMIDQVPSMVASFLKHKVDQVSKSKDNIKWTETVTDLCAILEVEQWLNAADAYGLKIWSKDGFLGVKRSYEQWKSDVFIGTFGVTPHLTWRTSDRVAIAACCEEHMQDAEAGNYCPACTPLLGKFKLRQDRKERNNVARSVLKASKDFGLGLLCGIVASSFFEIRNGFAVEVEASVSMNK